MGRYSSIRDDLDQAARLIVDEALDKGSKDNLTIQILHIEQLPLHDIEELHQQASALPFPPELRPRMLFDGYEIVREVHGSSRSHVYLAVDEESRKQVIIKTPSIDLREDAAYLDRFLMEEWVARRMDNAHVLKPCDQTRRTQLPLHRYRIHRRSNARPVDDRRYASLMMKPLTIVNRSPRACTHCTAMKCCTRI